MAASAEFHIPQFLSEMELPDVAFCQRMRTEMAVDTVMLDALRTWIEKLERFADETRRGAAALVAARQRKKRPVDGTESEPRRTRIEVVDDGDPPVAD